MSHGASICRHFGNPPDATNVLRGFPREQGWRPGTIVTSVPSQLEIDTQVVVDRLLRECFTQKSPDSTGRTDTR